MRKSPTPAEELLWTALRRNSLGVPFRRQHPVGPFIADFVCLSHKLVVEVDGSVHEAEDQVEYDAARTEYLRVRNFRIVRFRNAEVLSDLDGVITHLKQLLSEPSIPSE